MKNLPLTAVALASAISGAAWAQQKPVLTVYTYDSFVSEWGPGPHIEAAFEASCDCDLKLIGAGDGAALLSRIRLEAGRSEADVVLGLDTTLTALARETGLFAPYEADFAYLDVPVEWDDELFLPYDWGYFAFVYDNTRLSDVPDSLEALRNAPEDLKIIIQDPRSSTPGLGLLMWVKKVYGDEAGAFWRDLAPHIVTVTQGWSEAYGLFLEGEADMVLSYTTSPAYHLIAENDPSKSAASFSEGHYLQIEVAGKLAASDQPDLADAFLSFMVSEGFQSVIPTTNWMYPAVFPIDGLPSGFETLITPTESLILNPRRAKDLKDEALQEWLTALSR